MVPHSAWLLIITGLQGVSHTTAWLLIITGLQGVVPHYAWLLIITGLQGVVPHYCMVTNYHRVAGCGPTLLHGY